MSYLYKGRYVELSNYAHAVSTLFIAPAVPAYVLAVVTMCLLKASERICERYNDCISEDLRNRAAVLGTTFASYHKSCQYLELFAKDMMGQKTPRLNSPPNTNPHSVGHGRQFGIYSGGCEGRIESLFGGARAECSCPKRCIIDKGNEVPSATPALDAVSGLI